MSSNLLPPEQRIIRRITGRYDDPILEAFLLISQQVKGDVAIDAIAKVIEEVGADSPVRLYNVAQVRTLAGLFEVDLRPIITTILQSAGELALPVFAETHGFGAMDLDAFRQEAIDAAEKIGAEAIKRIAAAGREMVKAAVARGFEEGLTPMQIARNIQGGIGLDDRRAASFEKWLAALADDPPDASEEEIQRQIDLEYKRLLRQRAKMIARTELANTAAQGQQMVWERAVSEGKLNADRYVRVWLRIPGGKACRICDPLRGQRARLIGGYYQVGSRRYDRPPGHPNCRCGERLERAQDGDADLPQLHKAA